MTTVQPIYSTAAPHRWHALAGALGLTPACPGDQDWSEFVGDGVLAVHGVAPGDPRSGCVDLHVLVDDLARSEIDLSRAGFPSERSTRAGVGELLGVTVRSGATVTVSRGARMARTRSIAVLPVWYAPELAEPARLLQVLGLRPRIASDTGGWCDFSADGGGLVGLHLGADSRIELALGHGGDQDELAERLQQAGWMTTVIDEAYNRTVLVTMPEGARLTINGTQTDLYGYTRRD